jgi:hypothetical protein
MIELTRLNGNPRMLEVKLAGFLNDPEQKKEKAA